MLLLWSAHSTPLARAPVSARRGSLAAARRADYGEALVEEPVDPPGRAPGRQVERLPQAESTFIEIDTE
jgi:hypothetical protein